MNVDGKHYRTIWIDNDVVKIIDQRHLPHNFVVEELHSVNDVITAIKDFHVRGAGLIGATGGFGMYVAAKEAQDDASFMQLAKQIAVARPTAVNLQWAVDRQLNAMKAGQSKAQKLEIALKTAIEIADEDADFCKKIGEHGLEIIEAIHKKTAQPVNILTHCNAGWLAFVDYGSATSPIYAAHDKGIPVHVWVDETRPWNQGARLTAWELDKHGVPFSVIVDNLGGHLMQHGQVDMVIVGTDRTTYTGDVANKVGTYLKALAANDNNVPFYVALPSSTFDWQITDGMKIPIEERKSEEVKYATGLYQDDVVDVLMTPKDCNTRNYVFDVTPRRLVTSLITERGVVKADKNAILDLYPEHKK